MAHTFSPRLTRRVLAAYGLPALPLAAAYFPVYVFVAEFYAGTQGVPLATIGAIFLFVRIFDALSDPLAGLASDRIRNRFGRRRPWIAVAVPIVAIATWNLFAPPAGAGALWLCLWVFLLTFGWTIAMTPYFAWGAELSGNYRDRARIVIWREGLGLAGTIIAALIYGAADVAADGMRAIAGFVILTLPVAVAICLWQVPEPRDFSRSAPSLHAIWRTLRFNRLFQRLLAAFFLNGMANGVASALFIFFVAYRLDAPAMGGPLLVLYFSAALLGAPVWSWATGRMDKHRLWCWAMLYAGAVFVWMLVLGPGDWAFFAVICVFSGMALSADLSLPAAIQADVIDTATATDGAQQTGAFFALWSVVTKLALAGSSAGAFAYLGFFGFDIGSNGQRGHAALALLYGLAPIALKFAAVALMWNFPLNAAQVAQNRIRIETLSDRAENTAERIERR